MKKNSNKQELEIFVPKFSWRQQIWSWLQRIRIKKATNSYQKDKMRFGVCVH